MNIVEQAKLYIGQRETENNGGFESPSFQKKMQDIGWQLGDAWCASFVKLVWMEAYKCDLARLLELEHLFSPSAVATYRNFDASDWKTQNADGSPIRIPSVGALVVWRMGNSESGHIGIVTEVLSNTAFKSIEGNTNEAGGREGIEVAEKKRAINRRFLPNGLNLLGFILPK